MKNICVDSGFLIALYDTRDENHSRANEYFTEYFDRLKNQLLIPWPILYESISTRMVRNRMKIESLYRHWKILKERKSLDFIDDSPFREKALDAILEELNKEESHYRTLSLADRVIREILSEQGLMINFFITFNHRDFADICKRRRIEML